MDTLDLLKSIWIALIALAGALLVYCMYLVSHTWTRRRERADRDG
ncbi:hypothetical protein BH10PSE18_BH10PSE18_01500 [soil metagenome]